MSMFKLLTKNASRLTVPRVNFKFYSTNTNTAYSGPTGAGSATGANANNANSGSSNGNTGNQFNDTEQPNAKEPKSHFTKFAIGLGFLSSYLYLGYGTDQNEGESLLQAHNRRAYSELHKSYEYFFYPPSKKLLPILPKNMQKDYVLCVELTDALTHCVWDKNLGWRIAIRPGVKEFLYTLTNFYELVLFTDTPRHLAEPVFRTIDQVGFFPFQLYREHHKLEGDLQIKDLDYLNRNLERVVVLETDLSRLKEHPDNGLALKEWHATPLDNELYKMAEVLSALWASGNKIKDLRPLLNEIKSLGNGDTYQGWQSYKQNHRKVKPLLKESNGFVSELATSTTSILSSLVSNGITTKTESFGTITTIDQLERVSKSLERTISKDFKSFLKREEKMKQENARLMKEHLEKLKESDLTLLDYLTGNYPQPGQK